MEHGEYMRDSPRIDAIPGSMMTCCSINLPRTYIVFGRRVRGGSEPLLTVCSRALLTSSGQLDAPRGKDLLSTSLFTC